MSEKNNEIVIKKKNIVIGAAVILVLIIGAVILGLGLKGQTDSQPTASNVSASQNSLDIDPNAGKWTGEKPEDKSSGQVGIKIPGYPSITIPANQTDVTVALFNPEGNPCYFVFELVLKDTGETLYKSKLVPPGQAITNITLSKPLDTGEHNAVIKISTFSLEDQSAMNGANVETVLIAK
ncbi:MAG: hypothetical protein ACI4XP_10250 [Acutalibacteraceae bacterium]